MIYVGVTGWGDHDLLYTTQKNENINCRPTRDIFRPLKSIPRFMRFNR